VAGGLVEERGTPGLAGTHGPRLGDELFAQQVGEVVLDRRPVKAQFLGELGHREGLGREEVEDLEADAGGSRKHAESGVSRAEGILAASGPRGHGLDVGVPHTAVGAGSAASSRN